MHIPGSAIFNYVGLGGQNVHIPWDCDIEICGVRARMCTNKVGRGFKEGQTCSQSRGVPKILKHAPAEIPGTATSGYALELRPVRVFDGRGTPQSLADT